MSAHYRVADFTRSGVRSPDQQLAGDKHDGDDLFHTPDYQPTNHTECDKICSSSPDRGV